MDAGSSSGSFDPEALYQTSNEWLALGQSIEVIKNQLEQAKKDVEELQRMKEEALANPDEFLAKLRNQEVEFPRMQNISRIPDLDLSRYSKRTSRRGNSKYEQNLEFLLGRVQDIHRRTCPVPPVLLSSSIPVSSLAPSLGSATSVTGSVREKFYEISGYPPIRPVSAPAPAFFGTDTPPSLSESATPVPSTMDYESSYQSSASKVSSGGGMIEPSHPQPRSQRTHRVSLAEKNDQVTVHYNLPWSDQEKKRLEELLVIYPEEAVSARRYAKIAQALGTRTASQVTNRIHKLNAKRAKQAKREAEAARDQATKVLKTLHKSGALPAEGDEDEELLLLEVDDETKESSDYQEYMKLKEQLDELKAQTVEHFGVKCDSCGMEPIIGVRHHCEQCPQDFDLCQACMGFQLSGEAMRLHDPSHTFTRITIA